MTQDIFGQGIAATLVSVCACLLLHFQFIIGKVLKLTTVVCFVAMATTAGEVSEGNIFVSTLSGNNHTTCHC